MNQQIVLDSEILEELCRRLSALVWEMQDIRYELRLARGCVAAQEQNELLQSLRAVDRQMMRVQRQVQTIACRMEQVIDQFDLCEKLVLHQVTEDAEDALPARAGLFQEDNHSSPKSYHSSKTLFN